MDYISGKRTVLDIPDRLVGWTGEDLSFPAVLRYLEILADIGQVVLGGSN